MTVSAIKVKVLRRPLLKFKLLPKFPSSVTGDIAITVDKTNGSYTIRPDYSGLSELATFDPSQELVLVYGRDGTWAIVPISTLVNNPTATVRVITAAVAVTVGNSDALIAMNKTVGAATSITLPLSSAKNGAVRIVDFKGDAGTNNITVNAAGSDKFNGNLTSWTIASDGGSILLSPLSGVGYAVS